MAWRIPHGKKFVEDQPPFDYKEWTPEKLKAIGQVLADLAMNPELPEEVREDAQYSRRHLILELYFGKADEIVREDGAA